MKYATVSDIEKLKRTLSDDEKKRAGAILEIVSDLLRAEADRVGKNLDKMIEEKPHLKNVAKSVTVDIVMRELMTSTNQEPMQQMSESGMGYSVSGTFLSPGGGIFIKEEEKKRLGLKQQRVGVAFARIGDEENAH